MSEWNCQTCGKPEAFARGGYCSTCFKLRMDNVPKALPHAIVAAARAYYDVNVRLDAALNDRVSVAEQAKALGEYKVAHDAMMLALEADAKERG